MSLKPICVPCARFYRPEKNGFTFLEGMPKSLPDRRVEPGLSEPENWDPYKLWRGDLWKCQGCGHTIVSGVGRDPLDEHYTHTFKQNVKTVEASHPSRRLFQVNDC